jgi:hypothetical protein
MVEHSDSALLFEGVFFWAASIHIGLPGERP